MGKGGKPRENAIRCQCGYCGSDSSSGLWFIPTRKDQKYLNRNHLLRHQYNGKLPFKRVCACGCGKKFVTINPSKYYIKGHQNIFRCEFCRADLTENEVFSKHMNGVTFYFCSECFSNINGMTLEKD